MAKANGTGFCRHCGKSVAPFLNGKLRLYCSRACMDQFAKRRPSYLAKHPPRIQERICEGCASSFVSLPRKAYYCSRICRNRLKRSRVPIEQKRISWKKRGERKRKFDRETWLDLRRKAKLARIDRLSLDRASNAVERKRVREAKILNGIKAKEAVTHACKACGIQFPMSRNRFCSDECRIKTAKECRRRARQTDKRRADKAADKAKRRMRQIVKVQRISPVKVFERDKWKCHICGLKTPRDLRGTYEDRAPELDHIVTLADGGTHTWGNVACACRRCNGLKNARSFGQMGFDLAA